MYTVEHSGLTENICSFVLTNHECKDSSVLTY